MSAFVTSCDRECSFVWLPSFISNVFHDLTYGFIRNVVFELFISFGSFHCNCFTNCKTMIYSMVVFDSIACSTVVSDPSFWCSDSGNVAPEEECKETIGVQPVGQEWQPNDVM